MDLIKFLKLFGALQAWKSVWAEVYKGLQEKGWWGTKIESPQTNNTWQEDVFKNAPMISGNNIPKANNNVNSN